MSPLHYVASSNLHRVPVTVTVTVTVTHVTVTVLVIIITVTVTVIHVTKNHHVTTYRTTGSSPSNPGNLADIESI